MNMKEIEPRMNELQNLWTMKKAAADAYKEAVRAVAEKAECNPQVLAQYVGAVMGDKLEQFGQRQEQMSLLLEVPRQTLPVPGRVEYRETA